MAFKQEINIPMVLTTGIVSVLILVVAVIGTQSWFENEEAAEISAKALEAPTGEFQLLKEHQTASLKRVGWTDANQKAVTIPIEQAMEIMVQTNGKLPSTQPAGG